MKNALLIIDMSNDFVHENGGLTAGEAAQTIVPFIQEKAEEFLKNGDEIYICMDAHQENDDHFKLWPVHNVVGTWGQQLYGSLHDWYLAHKHSPQVHWLPKTEYDAFHQTNLAKMLKQKEVQHLYLTGVCTDICVFNGAMGLANYYDQWNRDVTINVHEDAIATYSEDEREEYVQSAKLLMKQQGINLVSKKR